MYKCQLCGDNFVELEDLYGHLEDEHSDAIPKDFTIPQFYYYLKTGKSHGKCVICKMPTRWNDATGKYHRFCDMPECKEKYRQEFKQRMIGKYGRVHLLNDPEQQKKMLANRSISGKYKWSDGKEIPYTGSYELDFLKFLDLFMNFDSSDIMSPSPHTYYYLYEGEEKFYIPDFFIPSLSLEIEIKDGGDNPNKHHKIQEVDKVKERLKDQVMMSQKEFNYIKIVNKNYDPFFEFLFRLKKEFNEHGESYKRIFILGETPQIPKGKTGVVTEKSEARLFNENDLRLVYYKSILNESENKDEVLKAIGSIAVQLSIVKENENTKDYLNELRNIHTSLINKLSLCSENGVKAFDYEYDVEGLVEAFKVIDNEELEVSNLFYGTDAVLEMYDKSTRKQLNQIYNYTDRFKFGFLARNFDLLISNMMKNPQKTGNFKGIRDNLLEMVDRCKSISDINYLRRDKNAAKVLLTKLAENRPEIAKECKEHIKWIDTVYTQALNEKAKELRGQFIKESTVVGSDGSDREADLLFGKLFCEIQKFVENFDYLIIEDVHIEEPEDVIDYGSDDLLIASSKCFENMYELIEKMEELINELTSKFQFIKAGSNVSNNNEEFVLTHKNNDQVKLSIRVSGKEFYILLRRESEIDTVLNEASIKYTDYNLSVNGKKYYPVFVLLTHTGTTLATAIKKFTGDPYSHASISFDSSLENMYSFGRKYKDGKLVGSFVIENIRTGLFKNVADKATYSIYVTFVTEEEKELMEEKLRYFIDNEDSFKYNFRGLILHSLGIQSERDDAYFCSQFVDIVLSASGKDYFKQHHSMVRPYDFARHKDFHFVAKGLLKNYDQHKVDYKVKQIFEKLFVDKLTR
jgi:hypothetical protein